MRKRKKERGPREAAASRRERESNTAIGLTFRRAAYWLVDCTPTLHESLHSFYNYNTVDSYGTIINLGHCPGNYDTDSLDVATLVGRPFFNRDAAIGRDPNRGRLAAYLH